MTAGGGNYFARVLRVGDRALPQVSSGAAGVTATLSPQDGAELCSLRAHEPGGDGAGEGRELLYRANDWGPVDGWTGRAPWLWPAAGRSYVPSQLRGADPQTFNRDDCRWAWANQERPMPWHGFARSRPWSTPETEVAAASARCRTTLTSSGAERSWYPFDYALEVELAVEARRVALRFTVTADAGNAGPMPFQVGQHLTFDLASWWGKRWRAGTVAGLGERAWRTDPFMQPADSVALPDRVLTLDDEHLANALVPAALEQPIHLRGPGGRGEMELAMTAAWLPDDDAALWVVHRDPAGRFFCCEPWVGWPNALNTGRGRIELPPGEQWWWAVHLELKPSAAAPTGHARRRVGSVLS